jgi:hypothetical protein
VALETTVFQPDDDAVTDDYSLSVATRLELKHQHWPWTEVVRVLGRVDGRDRSRALLVPEEAYLGLSDRRVQLRLGFQLLHWTATEVFHPADVVNSRNLATGIGGAEKLGEPMATAAVTLGGGQLSLHVMPLRTAPVFPPARSRLSTTPGVALDTPLWVDRSGKSSADRLGLQWATRLTRTLGSADLAIHFVDHGDRHQPAIQAGPSPDRIRPVFLHVRQLGVSYVQVLGPWVVRGELARRRFVTPDAPAEMQSIPRDHSQLAAALEYAWSPGEGQQGLALFALQSILEAPAAERARLHPFQRDLLIGYRHAWDDVDGTELQLSLIVDLERPEEYLGSLRFARRLNEAWSFTGAGSVVHAPRKSLQPVGLEVIHRANQLQVVLTRHF